MKPWLGVAFVLACAHDHPVAPPAPIAPQAVASASANTIVALPAGGFGSIVWRVLDHAFVQDDGGVPREMWIKVQLEVDGKVVGSFKLDEPGCTLGSISGDKHVIAGLTCYYAGGGDYVEQCARRSRATTSSSRTTKANRIRTADATHPTDRSGVDRLEAPRNAHDPVGGSHGVGMDSPGGKIG